MGDIGGGGIFIFLPDLCESWLTSDFGGNEEKIVFRTFSFFHVLRKKTEVSEDFLFEVL